MFASSSAPVYTHTYIYIYNMCVYTYTYIVHIHIPRRSADELSRHWRTFPSNLLRGANSSSLTNFLVNDELCRQWRTSVLYVDQANKANKMTVRMKKQTTSWCLSTSYDPNGSVDALWLLASSEIKIRPLLVRRVQRCPSCDACSAAPPRSMSRLSSADLMKPIHEAKRKMYPMAVVSSDFQNSNLIC